MPTDPATRLREGKTITMYDRKKKVHCRCRRSTGGFYRMDDRRDSQYWETWPGKLELQDCLNIIGEIQEHNRQAKYPGQEQLKLNN